MINFDLSAVFHRPWGWALKWKNRELVCLLERWMPGTISDINRHNLA